MKTRIGAALAVAALLVASACGGGRPSTSTISDAIQDQDSTISAEEADCVADVLRGSDISDEGLQAIIDDDDDFEPSDDDEDALADIIGDIMECSTDGF